MKKTIFLFVFAVILYGCGGKSDTEYLETAEQSIKNNKIPEGVAAYEALVNEYPESPSAPKALFEIATLYQNKMISNIPPEQSLEKSVGYFRKVYEDYPDSKEAPKALFMSGFIRANEMQNFGEATKIYKLFLETYPKHELAAAAKQELDNMGLSPEEILQKKTASQQL